MKRRLLVAVPLLLLVVVLAWMFRPRHDSQGAAYVSDRNVTLWSSLAQVRQPVATLHYGEKVDVITRRNENVNVRTAAGQTGWVDGGRLVEPALWQRSVELLMRARSMPVQARGRTKVSTNLRVEPGRTQKRLIQFSRGVPVDVVGRAVADWVQTPEEKDSSGETQETKKEDWFLIRGAAAGFSGEAPARGSEAASVSEFSDSPVPVAGWVVARFIELDLPDPVREGTAAAGVRTLAWFELNRVSNPSGDKPQYLVAGVHGAEGQPCDFTTFRVYTWDARHSQYQTAFIDNNLCGQLPIRVGKGPKGEPEFRFFLMDKKEERVFHLVQTVVRRVHENETNAVKKKPAPAAKPPAMTKPAAG